MQQEWVTSAEDVLRFGVFELNLKARELRKHGVRVRLPGQPFQVLSMLLEHPGSLVTRSELQERLWRDTFVDRDHSLNVAVKKLRAVLGDTAENPRYVETIPRVGYRFIAPVETVTARAAPAGATEVAAAGRHAVPRSSRGWWLPGLLVAVVVASGGLGIWWARARNGSPAPRRAMLAVLPFENLTGDAKQDYLSDGLTEEVIGRVSQSNPERLGVVPASSVMRYKHNQRPLSEVGRELGVQYILEGGFRREGDRARISARLIEERDQALVWSREYDREMTSLLQLQDEIAQEIADEIAVTAGWRSARTSGAAAKANDTSSYEAYDLYLQGRFFWNKRTKEGFERAADFFQKAIEKDARYARAYAGLADTFALMSTWSLVDQGEYMAKAQEAALKALELNEGLAEAHASLGLIVERRAYDWPGAEREFRRAIQLDPHYATGYQWYAEWLSLRGRHAEAMEEIEKARQLDPMSLIIASDRGAILYLARRYDEALAQFRAVLTMDPTFPRAQVMMYVLVEKGMYEEALREAENWKHNDGTAVWESQAYIYGRWGRREAANRAIAKWEQWQRAGDKPITAVAVMAYVAAGRHDEAIRLLEVAATKHLSTIIEIGVAPCYDPLRGDPRFEALLRKVHLR